VNEFGFKLFKEIIKKERDKNVFISPLGISMALGMAYNGADGTTQDAIQRALELPDLSAQKINENCENLMKSLIQFDPKVKFQIANSIWHHLDVIPKKEFIELCQKYFMGSVRELDLSAINAWVDEQTHGMIKTILDSPIDPLVFIILINAIYFKGLWTHEFNKNLTKDAVFELSDGTKKPCRMMEQEGSFNYFGNDDFQAIDLPYGDGSFSITVLLPRLAKDIDLLIDKLNGDQLLEDLCWSMGTLHFPKFILEYELQLSNVLGTLGMGIAFNPNLANFSKISDVPKLWIDQVIHKAHIRIDEEGTEAAAVTAVVMSGMCAAPPTPRPFEMIVDHPFLFLIREKTSQTILFMGKVVAPNSKEEVHDQKRS